MKIIAKIRSAFKEKFGIPRQSGIISGTIAEIVFEPEYRNPDAVRGLEGFSHIWLIWNFSECEREDWSPTVRPPRLGGNRRMGVFATRAPYRPNPIGLSSVRLLEIKMSPEGPILVVSGADLLDGTPIYDIKPYLPYTDSHPDATGGFSDPVRAYEIAVEIPARLEEKIAPEDRDAIRQILEHDPRPAYQTDEERIYYLNYGPYEIAFRFEKNKLIITNIT